MRSHTVFLAIIAMIENLVSLGSARRPFTSAV